MKNLSIKVKLFAIVLAGLLLLSTVILIVNIKSIYSLRDKNIQIVKENLLKEIKKGLIAKSDIVYKIIEDSYKQTLPENIEKNAKETLKARMTIAYNI